MAEKLSVKSLLNTFNNIIDDAKTTIQGLAERVSNGTSKFLTPISTLSVGGDAPFTLFIKREDLTPVKSFKLRGAYNSLSVIAAENNEKKMLFAASAGNHAQGLAYSANALGFEATIVMPVGTPKVKKRKTDEFGGQAVFTKLEGSTFDAAATWAVNKAQDTGSIFVHPFDDMNVIAGQATIGHEILNQCEDNLPDIIFLPIGGGGLAAGISAYIKQKHPEIKIIGVEQEGQASMQAALNNGAPTALDQVNTFSDGTAVKLAGQFTHAICAKYLDGVVVVSTDEVSSSVKYLFEELTAIAEPSGALSLAGARQYAYSHPTEVAGKNILTVLSGANADPDKYASMLKNADIAAGREKLIQFTIHEQPGNLLRLLNKLSSNINITKFRYGAISNEYAQPIIGFKGSEEQIERLEILLSETNGIVWKDVTNHPVLSNGSFNFDPNKLKDSYFYNVEFPEKPGALLELLGALDEDTDLTYFDYDYEGPEGSQGTIAFNTSDKDRLDKILSLYIEKHSQIDNIYKEAAPTLPQYAL